MSEVFVTAKRGPGGEVDKGGESLDSGVALDRLSFEKEGRNGNHVRGGGGGLAIVIVQDV